MLKKLQKQKSQNKDDDTFARKLNDQVLGLQAELDTLEQEIELAKLPVSRGRGGEELREGDGGSGRGKKRGSK